MYTQDTDLAREWFTQKLAFTTGPYEVDAMIRRGDAITVVDVRLPTDFAKGHVPGAINLPKGKWHTLAGLKRERTTYVYCYSQTCKLAAEAAVLFAAEGYPVVEIEGGWDAWLANGLEVQK